MFTTRTRREVQHLARLLAGLTNLVLAMNGEPEPPGKQSTADLAQHLHELADRLRAEARKQA